MLGEIESNMKKTFRIKCFKLVLGVSLCFLIYLLVSLIIPPYARYPQEKITVG